MSGICPLFGVGSITGVTGDDKIAQMLEASRWMHNAVTGFCRIECEVTSESAECWFKYGCIDGRRLKRQELQNILGNFYRYLEHVEGDLKYVVDQLLDLARGTEVENDVENFVKSLNEGKDICKLTLWLYMRIKEKLEKR